MLIAADFRYMHREWCSEEKALIYITYLWRVMHMVGLVQLAYILSGAAPNSEETLLY
jgi:hypothetical protein